MIINIMILIDVSKIYQINIFVGFEFLDVDVAFVFIPDRELFAGGAF